VTHWYRALLAALLVTTTGSAASAFERARSESGAPEHFANVDVDTSPLTIAIDTRSLTSAERDAVMRAAATWAEASCAKLRFTLAATDTAVAPKGSAPIVIARGTLTNATFAAHTDVIAERDGMIMSATITLDEKRKFTTTADVAADAFDLESVVLHELGHALGLAHPIALNVPRAVVMKAGTKPGVKLRKLDADDVAGVCAIYSR
jgi:matrix metalloproteinase-8 (neutrophil collagenase)